MLTKIHNFIQATELRKNLSHYLKKAKDEPIMISTNRGEQVRVVMDGDLYNTIVEAYEDTVDSNLLKKLVKEDHGEYSSLDNLKKKYGV